MNQTKNITAKFYKSDKGNQPVKEWLLSLLKDERIIIGKDICKVEFGWPMGMPIVKKLEKDLWEVRSSLPSSRIARVFFTIYDKKMILLHGFIKKSNKTPKKDLDVAKERMRNFEG